MMDQTKYNPGYYNPPVAPQYRWVHKDHIEKAPQWCSVDLRDGNQSLIIPMNLEQKVEFFKMLVDIGFKEIEVGFPAASDTEYNFLRTLIDQNLIPEDVTVQVLTQCRDHIIRKTFEALDGAPNAIVHFYNSTSVAQREQVFKKSKEEIMQIAIEGATLVKELADEYDGDFRFEYSPESFTGTEPEYALDVCNAVLDILKPTKENPVIINLPATVSMSMSHVYANQIEYMSDNMKYRENVILSIHPHNDRGCGVADAELALLAGADRIEGTLFGNGERTGNVDIITLALNMYSHGVDPKLNFSNMPEIVKVYEEVTGMHVYERSPYAGALVFAAFSGSHQDAIAKGMKWGEEHHLHQWTVPYIPIDPTDIGRTYDADVIRVNSQSGKGGIGYILSMNYGYELPHDMREHFSYTVKGVSDRTHSEMKPDEIFEIFETSYLNKQTPLDVVEAHFVQDDGILAKVNIKLNDNVNAVSAHGNGRLDAVSNAIKKYTGIKFKIAHYSEHSLSQGSNSDAAAYVGIKLESGEIAWGAGTDSDIIKAGIKALVSAYNNSNYIV
ncbi:MAG: 2-isopropylmalate synthase [Lachnospiraceae bacterium]|nr:2-isopropylmalate synthase [Lachnospiraceae bacterium]